MPELAIKNVPRLMVKQDSQPTNDHETVHNFCYDLAGHEDLPHVIKFSGGRTSGMMLFLLLESALLKAERGDVVLFNNTAAEHPATY